MPPQRAEEGAQILRTHGVFRFVAHTDAVVRLQVGVDVLANGQTAATMPAPKRIVCTLVICSQTLPRHLAPSQRREVYAEPLLNITVGPLLLFARSPGHPVDEIHAQGGFLAEEGGPIVDVHLGAAPAAVNKERATVRPGLEGHVPMPPSLGLLETFKSCLLISWSRSMALDATRLVRPGLFARYRVRLDRSVEVEGKFNYCVDGEAGPVTGRARQMSRALQRCRTASSYLFSSNGGMHFGRGQHESKAASGCRCRKRRQILHTLVHLLTVFHDNRQICILPYRIHSR